jgi:hypothetical protein
MEPANNGATAIAFGTNMTVALQLDRAVCGRAGESRVVALSVVIACSA